MNTTCIIGDIHGSYNSLTALLQLVEHRADTIVFLGDYIDRGPDSKKVVERVLQLKRKRPHVITLLGNHEYMLLNYLAGLDDDLFIKVGGRETLTSYGLSPGISSQDARDAFPRDHLAFLQDLPMLWENQHGIYVHAGLQPGIHLSRQTGEWCLWVRDEFIQSSYNFGKPVVFGHTVFKNPLIQKNKIGIDTGAVYGQSLTALLLPEMEFISVPGEQDHPYPQHY